MIELPQVSTAKLIGFGAAALAVALFIGLAFHWRSEMVERGEWQREVAAATREAAANPKLSKDLVAQQIRLLGTAYKQCKAALASQSAAVDQLAARTAELENMATAAGKRTAQRVDRVEAMRTRLDTSAHSSAAQAKPCDPSAALQEAWR